MVFNRDEKGKFWMFYKMPLVQTPQPEGGYTVTWLLLPELVAKGNLLDEALKNIQDAVTAVVEVYQDLGRSLSATVAELGCSVERFAAPWFKW